MKITNDHYGNRSWEYTPEETPAAQQHEKDFARQKQDFWAMQFARLFVTLAYLFTVGMGTILAYKAMSR